METKQFSSIVFIYVKLPVVLNERRLLDHPSTASVFANSEIFSRDLEQLFFRDKNRGQFVKIGEGAFLVDEDAWYPNMLSMMKWCDENKFPYVMVPVGDSALTFSEENQDTVRWLAGKEKRSRISRCVPPQAV